MKTIFQNNKFNPFFYGLFVNQERNQTPAVPSVWDKPEAKTADDDVKDGIKDIKSAAGEVESAKKLEAAKDQAGKDFDKKMQELDKKISDYSLGDELRAAAIKELIKYDDKETKAFRGTILSNITQEKGKTSEVDHATSQGKQMTFEEWKSYADKGVKELNDNLEKFMGIKDISINKEGKLVVLCNGAPNSQGFEWAKVDLPKIEGQEKFFNMKYGSTELNGLPLPEQVLLEKVLEKFPAVLAKLTEGNKTDIYQKYLNENTVKFTLEGRADFTGGKFEDNLLLAEKRGNAAKAAILKMAPWIPAQNIEVKPVVCGFAGNPIEKGQLDATWKLLLDKYNENEVDKSKGEKEISLKDLQKKADSYSYNAEAYQPADEKQFFDTYMGGGDVKGVNVQINKIEPAKGGAVAGKGAPAATPKPITRGEEELAGRD